MNNRIYFLLSGIIFGTVAVLHLLRIFNHWTVILGPCVLPMWPSWVGFVIAGLLCLWAFRLLGR